MVINRCGRRSKKRRWCKETREIEEGKDVIYMDKNDVPNLPKALGYLNFLIWDFFSNS